MRFALYVVGFFALVATACAAPPEYPLDVSQWRETSIPLETDKVARALWYYAADYSSFNWRVFTQDGRVCAQDEGARRPQQHGGPKFKPTVADQFLGLPTSFARVSGGWLVGFNQGEFGGAVYWFSADGKTHYKISDDQVVAFFSLPDGLYAIQGLAHLTYSGGSIVRFYQSDKPAHWQASTAIQLPLAPYAISLRQDHTMLITLSDSLVSVGPEKKIATLVSNPPWSGLYPTSSVLTADEQKLYIGLRQFVAEYDIPSKTVRLLVPSDAFINKLSREDEAKVREPFGS